MPRPKTAPTQTTPVEALFNLSELTGSWLRDMGLATYGDLCRADLIDVWLELRSRHSQVSRLMYYALWGAVNNQHWNKIPAAEKAKLDGL